MRKFVITGASGGGKSTLISALAAQGYATVAEVGRQIVQEQTSLGGTALPWLDSVGFMDLLFARSIAAFDQIQDGGSEAVVFDRSHLEAIAYGQIIGRPAPEDMRKEADQRRFETLVLVCPPWREIFTSDQERKHDFDFAIRDFEANMTIYREAGYIFSEVPRGSVSQRVAFVKQQLEDWLGV